MDISLDNIVVDKDGAVKFVDFENMILVEKSKNGMFIYFANSFKLRMIRIAIGYCYKLSQFNKSVSSDLWTWYIRTFLSSFSHNFL